MFNSPGLAGKFFESYVPRINEQPAKDERPITSLTYNDYHYVQWYLKGSWAFWDLEASVGRGSLLQALSSVYRKHAGREIDYDTFVRALGLSLGADVSAHFDHWFKDRGFEPLHRK